MIVQQLQQPWNDKVSIGKLIIENKNHHQQVKPKT